MKRVYVVLLCLLFTGFCACGPVSTEKMAKRDPYARVIKTHQRHGYGYYYYALYDIDGNGTEELLLGTHAWQDLIGFHVVYSIQNGKAVQEEPFGLWHWDHGFPPLLLKNGVIRSDITLPADLRYFYYRFENGKLTFQKGLLEDTHEYFRIDPDDEERIPITKEEYDRLQKEYEGDGETVELDWKPLAEYGR